MDRAESGGSRHREELKATTRRHSARASYGALGVRRSAFTRRRKRSSSFVTTLDRFAFARDNGGGARVPRMPIQPSSFRDAPEGADPESIFPQDVLTNGFRARSLPSRPGMTTTRI